MNTWWERIQYRIISNPAPSRRAADTVFIVFAAIFSGILQLAANYPAPSVKDLFGYVISLIWAVGLFTFGTICAIGLYWPEETTGLLIERAGRIALFSSSFIYSVLVLWQNHLAAIVPASFGFGFAFACLYRAVHITLWVRQKKVINNYEF